jgi:hypothetical protein
MNRNIISMADYLARKKRKQQDTERPLAQDRPGPACQEAGKTTAVIIPFPKPGPRRPAA